MCREPSLTAYSQDLRALLGCCQVHDREPLRVSRGELEMYVGNMESGGYAAATVARRFGTVATFYKYAVIGALVPGPVLGTRTGRRMDRAGHPASEPVYAAMIPEGTSSTSVVRIHHTQRP